MAQVLESISPIDTFKPLQIVLCERLNRNLYFCSDIDLVVVGKWSDPPLYTLYEELLKSEIPKPDEIVVLDKAAVSRLVFLVIKIVTVL